MKAKYFRRSSIAAFVLAVAFVALPCFRAEAKESADEALVRQGKRYEAALLLEKKTKDIAAQKRAAEIYLELALFDEALARLKDSGSDEASARSAVSQAALAQGFYASALRLASSGDASIRAKLAPRELAEGRSISALALARSIGDEATVSASGKAAYLESLRAAFVRVRHDDPAYRLISFSPEGRFLLWWKEDYSQIQVLDTRLPRPASRGRAVARGGLTVTSFAVDSDGRFIAMIGYTKDKKGKESLSLALQRLDTGLEVRSLPISGKLPQGRASRLVFAGKGLCAQIGKTLVLVDPLSGAARGAAPLDEGTSLGRYVPESDVLLCWGRAADSSRAFGAATLAPMQLPAPSGKSAKVNLKGMTVSYFPREELGIVLHFIDSWTETIRVDDYTTGDNLRTGRLTGALGEDEELRFTSARGASLSPDASTLAILDRDSVYLAPFPFIDRAETAARLAKEFGEEEDFRALGVRLMNSGKDKVGLALLALAGVDDAGISRIRGEQHLKKGEMIMAAESFIKAGDIDRALRIADERLASADHYNLDPRLRDAKFIYEKAGAPLVALYLAAGRLAEKQMYAGAALDYYVEAGAKEDAERLLFNPASLDRERSFSLGAKIGMTEGQIYARLLQIYEGKKDYTGMAELYLKRRDDAGLLKVVKTAFAGNGWDTGLIDAVKERGEGSISRAAASLLIDRDQWGYAREILEAAKDSASLIRLADRAWTAGDFLFASTLYEKNGAKSVNAKSAARLSLVFEELRVPVGKAQRQFSESTVNRINDGTLPIVWPIPQAKIGEQGYSELRILGQDLIDLPSKPSSAEARKCFDCLGVTATRWEKSGQIEQASFDLARATWYGLAAKLLAAMGR